MCADPTEQRDIAAAFPERTEALRRQLGDMGDHDLDAPRSWRLGAR